MASADRRAAARLLFERSDADPEWIAAVWGVEPGWLAGLMAREGWERRATDARATIDRLMRQVSAQLAAFEADDQTSGKEGGKARLDALLAITRTFDKLVEMRREEDGRRSGEGDARALEAARRTVERRVGELAEQRADAMVGAVGTNASPRSRHVASVPSSGSR